MGGFTLESAIALCGTDDVGTIDLVSSLSTSLYSLWTCKKRMARYRLLEPIRQFAREKLEDIGETQGASQRHAQVYAAIARDGYQEWDANPRRDWLSRFEQELANFRAALSWTTGEANDLGLGAQIAGDTAPVFMRLTLLSEGTQWCEGALGVGATLPPDIEGRLRYTLSMLYNNQGATEERPRASAWRRVPLFRLAADDRDSLGALSGCKSIRYRKRSRRPQSRPPLQAWSSRANSATGDCSPTCCGAVRSVSPRMAARVCERVYAESAALSQSLSLDDDAARALQWWGSIRG